MHGLEIINALNERASETAQSERARMRQIIRDEINRAFAAAMES